MTAEWIGLGGLVALLTLLFLRVPVAVSMGVVGGCRDDGLDWHRSRRKSFTHGSMD